MQQILFGYEMVVNSRLNGVMKKSKGSATVFLLVNMDSEKDFRIPFRRAQRTWGPAPKPPRFFKA